MFSALVLGRVHPSPQGRSPTWPTSPTAWQGGQEPATADCGLFQHCVPLSANGQTRSGDRVFAPVHGTMLELSV